MNMTFVSSREVKKIVYFICGFMAYILEMYIFDFTRWNKSHIHNKNLNIFYLFSAMCLKKIEIR